MTKKNRIRPFLGVTVDREVYDFIVSKAEKESRSRSQVVSIIIRDFFSKNGDSPLLAEVLAQGQTNK